MAKLDRYIGTQVFFAILAVLGIILGLALLFAFIDELSDLNKGDYGLGQVLWYVLLTAPRRAYEMLPMAALIGCLIGLGTLASNSELTIMRAAGVSIGRIVWAVMKPMLVLMLAGILIGEYVAPLTENQAQADRALAQGGGAAQSSKRGMWHRQGQEYVHINAVQPNGILLGVTRYRFDDDEDQQRQRQAPLQFSLQAWIVATEQLASRCGLALTGFDGDFRLGQQHAIGVVLDGTVIRLARLTIIAIAVFQNQITTAIRLNFLTTTFGDQHGDTALGTTIGGEALLRHEHAAQLATIR